MEVSTINRFNKDLRKLPDKKLQPVILSIIKDIHTAEKITDIKGVRKLKGTATPNFYRIKTTALKDYRITFQHKEEDNSPVVLLRLLHRKEVYKKN